MNTNTDDPRDKTYREHFRHALSLCKQDIPDLTDQLIEEILTEVAQDEGLRRILPSIDTHMSELGDEEKLRIGWECTKLYASEKFHRLT